MLIYAPHPLPSRSSCAVRAEAPELRPRVSRPRVSRPRRRLRHRPCEQSRACCLNEHSSHFKPIADPRLSRRFLFSAIWAADADRAEIELRGWSADAEVPEEAGLAEGVLRGWAAGAELPEDAGWPEVGLRG